MYGGKRTLAFVKQQSANTQKCNRSYILCQIPLKIEPLNLECRKQVNKNTTACKEIYRIVKRGKKLLIMTNRPFMPKFSACCL